MMRLFDLVVSVVYVERLAFVECDFVGISPAIKDSSFIYGSHWKSVDIAIWNVFI